MVTSPPWITFGAPLPHDRDQMGQPSSFFNLLPGQNELPFPHTSQTQALSLLGKLIHLVSKAPPDVVPQGKPFETTFETIFNLNHNTPLTVRRMVYLKMTHFLRINPKI